LLLPPGLSEGYASVWNRDIKRAGSWKKRQGDFLGLDGGRMIGSGSGGWGYHNKADFLEPE